MTVYDADCNTEAAKIALKAAVADLEGVKVNALQHAMTVHVADSNTEPTKLAVKEAVADFELVSKRSPAQNDCNTKAAKLDCERSHCRS